MSGGWTLCGSSEHGLDDFDAVPGTSVLSMRHEILTVLPKRLDDFLLDFSRFDRAIGMFPPDEAETCDYSQQPDITTT